MGLTLAQLAPSAVFNLQLIGARPQNSGSHTAHSPSSETVKTSILPPRHLPMPRPRGAAVPLLSAPVPAQAAETAGQPRQLAGLQVEGRLEMLKAAQMRPSTSVCGSQQPLSSLP